MHVLRKHVLSKGNIAANMVSRRVCQSAGIRIWWHNHMKKVFLSGSCNASHYHILGKWSFWQFASRLARSIIWSIWKHQISVTSGKPQSLPSTRQEIWESTDIFRLSFYPSSPWHSCQVFKYRSSFPSTWTEWSFEPLSQVDIQWGPMDSSERSHFGTISTNPFADIKAMALRARCLNRWLHLAASWQVSGMRSFSL